MPAGVMAGMHGESRWPGRESECERVEQRDQTTERYNTDQWLSGRQVRVTSLIHLAFLECRAGGSRIDRTVSSWPDSHSIEHFSQVRFVDYRSIASTTDSRR